MGEHTSDREGEETERQEDSENAHGCGEKGEGRGLKMEIEYKSVLIGVVDRQSLLFVWAAIAVTSTGGKKKVISSRFHASQNSTLHSPAVDKRCEKTREADGQDKGRPFPWNLPIFTLTLRLAAAAHSKSRKSRAGQRKLEINMTLFAA